LSRTLCADVIIPTQLQCPPAKVFCNGDVRAVTYADNWKIVERSAVGTKRDPCRVLRLRNRRSTHIYGPWFVARSSSACFSVRTWRTFPIGALSRHRTSACIGAKGVACAIRLPVGHEHVAESLNSATLSLNHW